MLINSVLLHNLICQDSSLSVTNSLIHWNCNKDNLQRICPIWQLNFNFGMCEAFKKQQVFMQLNIPANFIHSENTVLRSI